MVCVEELEDCRWSNVGQQESVWCVDVQSVERPWTDVKSREDDPVAYNACDDGSVSRDKLRARVKSEDESQVHACD